MVGRQFIAGSIQKTDRVPEGRLKSERLPDPKVKLTCPAIRKARFSSVSLGRGAGSGSTRR
jgi:hypothetical protein